MTAPISTPYPGLFTVHTTSREELVRLVGRRGSAPLIAVAAPALSSADPLPPLPPTRFTTTLTAEAAAAGVPVAAVLAVVLAMTDAAMPATALPGFLAAVQLPPTWIVGTRAQCAAALRAAEAVVAGVPYEGHR